MKVEQKIVMIYTILGLVSGLVTNYLFMIGFGLVAVIASSFTVYFVSLLPFMHLAKIKKKILFYNSFITFTLVWFIVWVLLYSLSTQ